MGVAAHGVGFDRSAELIDAARNARRNTNRRCVAPKSLFRAHVTPPCLSETMSGEQLDAVVATARSALDVLASVDVGSCDRVELDAVRAEWRAVRSFTDVFEVRIARRARELAADGHSERPEGVLRDGGRRSTKDAKAAADREQVCDEMPIFEAALSDGGVSTGHLDAVASATRSLDDN